jgi:hypothetical protein
METVYYLNSLWQYPTKGDRRRKVLYLEVPALGGWFTKTELIEAGFDAKPIDRHPNVRAQHEAIEADRAFRAQAIQL